MLNTVQNGKGSKPRPGNKAEYDKNYDSIKWNSSIKKTKKVKTTDIKKGK